MKHLKKYNESLNEQLDVEYIRMCFTDIIDDYGANRDIRLQTDEPEIVSGYVHKPSAYGGRFKESWQIRIKLGDDSDGGVTSATGRSTYKVGYNLDKLMQESEERTKILQDIDVAIKRLRDKYDYQVLIDKEFTSFEERSLSKQGWKEEFIIIRIEFI